MIRLRRRGEPDTGPDRAAPDQELRQARLEAARRNAHWTELEDDLVPRARGLRVSASTDRVYTAYRGQVWETGSATAIADQAELRFLVNDDDHLEFLEEQAEPWSAYVQRQAVRDRRRRNPSPPMRGTT